MKGSVLIIEDVGELAELISLYLAKEGLEIKTAESAEAALAILEAWEPDLIILDLNLPGMDGFEFLQTYRRTRNTPVMIVSARNSDEDLISGFATGADEFVTKPFSPRVLAARVRALLLRVRQAPEKAEARIFRFGPFTLDYDACVLKKEDPSELVRGELVRGELVRSGVVRNESARKVQLSAREYEVLAYLSEQAGRPSTPEQIYGACWKNTYGDLTTVAVYIQRLRKKIEDDPAEPQYIETVHGMGYRLNAKGS
ncbi:DNA-binding response regulator [Spirochaetia bacterium]|nr:DNA-binding response regulator [Spirochaetia bacterium]